MTTWVYMVFILRLMMLGLQIHFALLFFKIKPLDNV